MTTTMMIERAKRPGTMKKHAESIAGELSTMRSRTSFGALEETA